MASMDYHRLYVPQPRPCDCLMSLLCGEHCVALIPLQLARETKSYGSHFLHHYDWLPGVAGYE